MSAAGTAVGGEGTPGAGNGSATTSWPRRVWGGIAMLWRPEALQRWAAPYRRQSGIKAMAVRQLEAFLLALSKALRQDILNQAAALTYNTLLGLVPLLAVAFAVFEAFGGLQRFRAPLHQFILENLAAGTAVQVGEWLDRFIARVNAGAIAGVSVLFLMWSAVALLITVEGILNRIWAVRHGRPILTRIITYWGILTLIPPLLAVSISMTARLKREVADLLGVLPFGIGGWLMDIAGTLAISLAFVVIYVVMPNTKVRLAPALIGGIVAGFIWSLLKTLFVTVVAGSASYGLIYGTLGLLPFLMLWLWVSWIVVLFGANLTAANQSLHTEGLELSRLELSQSFRERLAVRLAVAVARAFRAGAPAPTVEELADAVGTSGAVVRPVLDVLVEHQIFAEVARPRGDQGYLPGRDIETLHLSEVIAALRYGDGASLELAGEPVGAEAVAVMERAEAAGRELLYRLSLRELAELGS